MNTKVRDLLSQMISIYSNHPSIKLINENVVKGNLSFSTVKLVFTFGSIPPKFHKENSSICCKPLTDIINSGICCKPLTEIINSGICCKPLTDIINSGICCKRLTDIIKVCNKYHYL